MAVSKQTITVGILAIASGLTAAYGARAYLNREPPPAVEAPAKPKPLKVPIATLDLPAGRVLALGDIALFPMSEETIVKRHRQPELLMMSPNDIIGRRLREPLRQGEPFLTTALYPAGTGPNLTEKLKVGYRALNLYLSTGRTNGVVPGTYADLLFRTFPRAAKGGSTPIQEMVVTLLTNVEVLDFVPEKGTPGTNIGGGPGLVALAVPVDQVSRIEVLVGRGEFSIVPRTSDDSVSLRALGSDRMTIEDALGLEPLPPPTPPFQTVIYRRTDAKVHTFVGNHLIQQSQIPGSETAMTADGAPLHAAEPAADSASSNGATPTAFRGGSGEKDCPGCAEKRRAAQAKNQAAQASDTLTPTPAQRFAPQPTPARRGSRR